MQQTGKREFEICGTIVGTLNEDSPEFLDKWEGPSSWNFSGWTYSLYREKVEQAKKEPRMDSLDEAKKILEEECPFSPLFNYTHLYAHSQGLEGFIFDSEGCVDFSGVKK